MLSVRQAQTLSAVFTPNDADDYKTVKRVDNDQHHHVAGVIPVVIVIPNTADFETIATLPGGWDLAHAIRLGIKPFAELGANSEALSGSQVDSPCSCRAIFKSAPVAML